MKKICMALAAAFIALTAMAEGYQVNTFSAKQEGMGHVGVAMNLGAESTIFNPGALSFMGKTFEVSGSVSAISSFVTCTHNGSAYETDNKVSTPMNVSAAFRIYDNLYAGISLYTPYGSSINWGVNWPGAALNQSVDLKVFTVQPTFSWRIIPKLSVGAGLMIAWGNVDLNKGLVSGSSFARLVGLLQSQGMAPAGAAWDPSMSPAYAQLVGSSELALGFNVGALYEVNDKINIGASFRSKMNMHVKAGDVSVRYAQGLPEKVLGETLNNVNQANFDASMPCPYVLTAGISYKPIDRLILAFDAQLNGWSAYKSLVIKFALPTPTFDQDLTKDYKNAMTYHFGAQFAMTPRLDLRAGLMLDTNPCNKNYYNPETPGTTKIEPSVGLSFRPINGLSIDLAFMYVHGMKQTDMVGQYDDFIYKYVAGNFGPQVAEAAQLKPVGEFKADYKLHAFIPAIGVSYSF